MVNDGTDSVVAVDLTTGARTEFISRNTPVSGGGSSSWSSYNWVVDKQTNQLIVIDNFFNDMYLADLDSGIRRNINAPTDMLLKTFGLRAAVYNPSNNSLVMVEGYRDALIAVDIKTGEAVVLSQ